MERTGRVERIHIAPESGAAMAGQETVEAVAGRGIRGDRYFYDAGLWNRLDDERGTQGASEITFIEAEVLTAIERDYDVRLDPGAHRRNVTTRDVSLNHLVDVEFGVGEAVCRGVGLCEPCGYLQAITGNDGLGDALVHRGGLDAVVVESGRIAIDDPVRW